MSSGLMSCVRENSPPLETDECGFERTAEGPQSLPIARETHVQVLPPDRSPISNDGGRGGNGNGSSGSGVVSPTAEQQKRRRFHPLRNLRRIFRRRTITSVTDAPAAAGVHTRTLPTRERGGCSSNIAAASSQTQSKALAPQTSASEKNLRSSTLTSMSSASASASSPSSPLTHQQLQDAYNTQSLPKSKSYATGTQLQRDVILLAGGKGKFHQQKQSHNQQHQQSHQTLQYVNSGETSTDFDIIDEHNATNLNGIEMSSSTAYQHQQRLHHQQQQQQQQTFQERMTHTYGVAVLPPIGGSSGGGMRGQSFFTERQKLRSMDDSAQDLDSSENDSGPSENRRNVMHNSSSNSGEITDSQRSLSEGRLVDSEITRDGLSQSHDSVFSEYATASSLSIVLRAELADVLRKRRTRPDGSDEDLGLPRSPGSPQRRATQLEHSGRATNSSIFNNTAAAAATTTTTTTMTTNQSEISSVSLLSMTSTECDDFQATSTANNSLEQRAERGERTERTTTTSRYTRSATFSSMPTEILRHPTMSCSFNEDTKDEVDFFNLDSQRLSHSAARHKMAIRPVKKNVPTRQHRRTLECSIPEANEDAKSNSGGSKLESLNADLKAKSRSLPPGVNAKNLEQHAATTTKSKPSTFESSIHEKKTTNTSITTTPLTTKTANSACTTITSKSSSMSTSATATATASATASTSSETNVLQETFASSTKISSNNHTAGNKLFGLRAFSSASKQPTTTTTATTKTSTKIATESESKYSEKDKATMSTSTTTLESNESGFLRRLMQRNSKRNYAKANTAGDELDKNVVSEPKKIPISTSCFEMTTNQSNSNTSTLDKAKSAMSYEQSIEETRKGIKREIINEGRNGLSAILNNFTITTERSEQPTTSATTSSAVPIAKPRSGPAARQRYVPQDLSSATHQNESAKKPAMAMAIPQQEGFQSTTMIRDITAGNQHSQSIPFTAKQSPVKSPHRSNDTTPPHHHFEKKPKIVGLSAFQQKISRSNDSVVRLSASNNSLESSTDDHLMLTYDDVQDKHRRAVEKSRSFRTYTEEQRENTANVSTKRSNMPSLPDLTLNLRVPNYTQQFILRESQTPQSPTEPAEKCTSLGFEINDNSLLKPHVRSSESSGNLTHASQADNHSPYKRNFVMTTTGNSAATTPARILAPVNIVPQLPAGNISEIEQNIDMIVKSPFISVIRKSADLEHMDLRFDEPPRPNLGIQTEVFSTKTAFSSIPRETSSRPKSLVLAQKTKSDEQLAMSPTTAEVPLRTKAREVSRVTTSTKTTAATTPVKSKETERKSAPVTTAPPAASSAKTTRRSTSVNNEASTPSPQQQQPQTQQQQTAKGDVPEFMKIQLNHVDQARFLGKSNVVLAKNVKQPATTPTTTTPPATTKSEQPNVVETKIRCGSDESVIILERQSVEEQPKKLTPNVVCEKRVTEQPPKNLTKQTTTPLNSPVKDEIVVMRSKVATAEQPQPQQQPKQASTSSDNKISIVERRRLFMADTLEQDKTVKKMEDIRGERKKSMSEEVYRKLSTCGRLEEKKMSVPATSSPTSTPTTPATPITPTSPTKLLSPVGANTFSAIKTPVNNAANSVANVNPHVNDAAPIVVLRKKSFGMNTPIANGNNVNNTTTPNNSNDNNSNNNSPHKEDSTPELMKVFARRSLKVKDEDIAALSEKIQTNNTSNARKINSNNQNLDSDKENQSSSEEKLHKLSVDLEQMTSVSKITNPKLQISTNHASTTNNRTSLVDFRNSAPKKDTVTVNGTASNGSSSNNNAPNNVKSQLPPIKTSNGFRASISASNGVGTAPTRSNGHFTDLPQSQTNANPNNNNNNINANNNTFNTNNTNNTNATKRISERQSLNIKTMEVKNPIVDMTTTDTTTTTTTTSISTPTPATITKSIERSKTIGEFKGIHQRRAEWERRAKEALK